MTKHYRKVIDVSDIRSVILKQEYVGHSHWVSTVKLGKAYEDMKTGRYETMIVGYDGEWLDFERRCYTLDEAFKQHEEAKLYALELEQKK